MSTAAIVGFLVAGFFVGNLAFASVARWIYVVWEIWRAPRAPAEHAGVGWRLVAGTLFSSGPWILIALAFVAYHVHSEAWAIWLFAGIAGAIACFGLLTVYIRRRVTAPSTDSVGEGQLPDRRRRPIRTSVGELAFSYGVGLVCSLIIVPVMFDGFDAPPIIWAFFVFWGILLGYMGHRMGKEPFHIKPWVERRKTPSKNDGAV